MPIYYEGVRKTLIGGDNMSLEQKIPDNIIVIPHTHPLRWIMMFYALPKEMFEKLPEYRQLPRNMRPIQVSEKYMRMITCDDFLVMILQVLSFVAENERNNIRQRQAEGIAAARARGVHLGRPVKEAPVDFDRIVKAWEKKEITMTEVMQMTGMSETTFYRRRREMQLIRGKRNQPS